MISRSDWEPLPTPTLSPFCTRVPFSVSVFTAAVWCVPALRVPLVHSLINHFRQKVGLLENEPTAPAEHSVRNQTVKIPEKIIGGAPRVPNGQ